MQILIPWGLIAIFTSFSLFYYFNRKAQIKRQERRDKLNEKRQELLDAILKSKRDNKDEHQEK